MDIPGVPMPDFDAGEKATFGIIEGTQIGYIYEIHWNGGEEQFFNAVNTLMNDYETTGLIIDIRMNYGGGKWRDPMKGLSLLYNTREFTIDHVERCNPNDHLALCAFNRQGYTIIDGRASSYYDKPIAVIIGPGAISMGDQFPLWMKSHPMTRYFGKPTMGAYTGMVYDNSVYPEWYYGNSIWNSCLVANPSDYLARYEIGIDEDVCFTPDDVAQGYDTVVEATKNWINSQQGTQPDITYEPVSIDVPLNYGEITTQDLTIYNNGTRYLFYSLTPHIENGLRIADDGLGLNVIISTE